MTFSRLVLLPSLLRINKRRARLLRCWYRKELFMVFNNDVLIGGLERIVKKKKARFLCLMFK